MSTAENIDDALDDLITLKLFSERTGVTKKSIYEKIRIGVWQEGEEFFRDPQGKIWISRSGYQQWIKSGSKKHSQPELSQEKIQSKSSSSSRAKLRIVTKRSISNPPQLI